MQTGRHGRRPPGGISTEGSKAAGEKEEEWEPLLSLPPRWQHSRWATERKDRKEGLDSGKQTSECGVGRRKQVRFPLWEFSWALQRNASQIADGQGGGMGSLHGLFCSSKRFSAWLSSIRCFINQFFKHKLSTCMLQVPTGTFGRERPQNMMPSLWKGLIALVKHTHKEKNTSQILRWGIEMATKPHTVFRQRSQFSPQTGFTGLWSVDCTGEQSQDTKNPQGAMASLLQPEKLIPSTAEPYPSKELQF